jgi:putative drug exporter of the RND superfamily
LVRRRPAERRWHRRAVSADAGGVPAALHGSKLNVLVGGQTALADDFASQLSAKLPLFVGMIVALSFILLMIVFRSLAIPATAAIMNLLSAAAAFGVIVAVFQWGWLDSLAARRSPAGPSRPPPSS